MLSVDGRNIKHWEGSRAGALWVCVAVSEQLGVMKVLSLIHVH